MPSCSAFKYTNILKKNKNKTFHQVYSEKWNKELCMKLIQSIRQTGNLPSDAGFFICDSRFHDNTCFVMSGKFC